MSKTVTDPGGLLPPLPQNVALAKAGKVQVNELKDYIARSRKGQKTIDPLAFPRPVYVAKMKKIGFDVKPDGTVVELKKAAP